MQESSASPQSLPEGYFTSIIDDILENIFQTNELIKNVLNGSLYGINKLESPKEPVFLSDFIRKHNAPSMRTLNFTQKGTNLLYSLNHLQVHKQFIYNLCGYHTLFNLIQVARLLKSQNLDEPFELFNPASFWKFHFTCSDYLDKYAAMKDLPRDKYPWTQYHIRWGDLERGFVKPLTDENSTFQKLISGNNNMKISQLTLHFQFQRMLYTQEGLAQLQAEIDDFIKDQNNPIHNIKFIMMGKFFISL